MQCKTPISPTLLHLPFSCYSALTEKPAQPEGKLVPGLKAPPARLACLASARGERGGRGARGKTCCVVVARPRLYRIRTSLKSARTHIRYSRYIPSDRKSGRRMPAADARGERHKRAGGEGQCRRGTARALLVYKPKGKSCETAQQTVTAWAGQRSAGSPCGPAGAP